MKKIIVKANKKPIVKFCNKIYLITLSKGLTNKVNKNKVNKNKVIENILEDINVFLQTPKEFNNRFIANVDYGAEEKKYDPSNKCYHRVLILNLRCNWQVIKDNNFPSFDVDIERFLILAINRNSVFENYEKIKEANIKNHEFICQSYNFNDYIISCDNKFTLDENKITDLKEILQAYFFMFPEGYNNDISS